MGSIKSTMFPKKYKSPKSKVEDCQRPIIEKLSVEYIDVEDAKEVLERNHCTAPMFDSSSVLKKSTSLQLGTVRSDYMEPWDSIPGKNIHNAVNVVNSQPIKKQEHFKDNFLSECRWYMGEINRREAEKLLVEQPLYAFIVRTKGEGEYTISLKYQFGYIHMKIDEEIGRYSLGACKTKTFLTLPDMINHYQRFPMIIEGVGSIHLKMPEFSKK